MPGRICTGQQGYYTALALHSQSCVWLRRKFSNDGTANGTGTVRAPQAHIILFGRGCRSFENVELASREISVLALVPPSCRHFATLASNSVRSVPQTHISILQTC